MDGTVIFSNALIFQGRKGFVKGSFVVSGDRFKEVLPDAEEFFRLQETSGSRIRIVDMAPELPGWKAGNLRGRFEITEKVLFPRVRCRSILPAWLGSAHGNPHVLNALRAGLRHPLQYDPAKRRF